MGSRGRAAAFRYWLLLIMLIAGCGGSSEPPLALPVPTGAPSPTPMAAPTPDIARLARQGERLADDLGCLDCHSTDGREFVGPTWKGLFGKTERFEAGGSVVVDDGYIRESIRDPKARIVEGYFDLMPSNDVSDADIAAIIEYIKTLK